MDKESVLSFNGHRCISKCVEAGKVLIHPLTGYIIRKDKNNFCLVDGFQEINISKNKHELQFADTCILDDKKNGETDIASVLLFPFEFDYKIFLNMLNIKSFDDGIDWIDQHKHNNNKTIIRVLRCILNVFWNEFNFMNNIFIVIFTNIVNNTFMPKIYGVVGDYINMKDGNVYVTQKKNDKLGENIIEKTNYIIDNYCNDDIIKIFLIKYAEKHTDDWKKIDNHINQMEKELIEHIEDKIKTTK